MTKVATYCVMAWYSYRCCTSTPTHHEYTFMLRDACVVDTHGTNKWISVNRNDWYGL